MSGTSADGIDAVVVRIAGRGRRLRAHVASHVHRPFSCDLNQTIIRVCLRGTVAEICRLNFLLGEEFAKAALAALRRAGLQAQDITAIGSHGQTIHHLPGGARGSTLQIGEPAVIAERTGIPTWADFRVRDMAAGGQGAPLVTFADWALMTDPRRPRIVQNIGGIANLTFLPAHAELGQVIAFDTGPGNMVIDAVVRELSHGRLGYDRNGAWAARGCISETLLQRGLAHPFFRRRPPKTTGREEFGKPFAQEFLGFARRHRLRSEDIVATATALSAKSIVNAWERFVFPKLNDVGRARLQVIVGGGGGRNATLQEMLRAGLRVGELLTHESFGIANGAKEALDFAILAHEAEAGRTNNVPSATGARHRVVMGKWCPGGISH